MCNIRFMRNIIYFIIPAVLTACLYAGTEPTFQELMDPAIFPDAQFGMEVKSVVLKEGLLTVETTGARMRWDLAAGEISFEQKIDHERTVLCVETVPITTEPVITHKGPGLGFIDFDSPDMELRINGDSLFMFHVHQPVQFVMRKQILPAFHANYGKANHLLLDEWGGFGIYCSDNKLDAGFDPYTEDGVVTAAYNMPADEVLWIGICPPRPFDWERSLTDQVVWHWDKYAAYPSDEQIDNWAPHGNIYLLQREMLLWKDWNLAFEPRYGMGEWDRVRDKIHGLGKRYMAYTSPSYYYTDSVWESYAFNGIAPEFDFKPAPMLPDGNNIDSFLTEVARVMKELKPDGLYYDGQYYKSIPATYKLARASRQIVGEKGLLEWHSTLSIGSNWCGMMYLPQADAYVDYILRGELFDGNFDHQKYLRYFISCYNISNSIGHLCITDPAGLTKSQGQLLARNNARLHTVCWWIDDPNYNNDFETNYRSMLKPGLQGYVEDISNKRQEAFKTEWLDILAERKSIKTIPVFDKPIFEEEFRSVPDWELNISPSNSDPFSTYLWHALKINACADTYAYLKKDEGLPEKVRAIQIKIKQLSDGGRAWGPSAALKWDIYNIIKIGTRADGKLYVKVNQEEQLLGTFDKDKWIHIRARWGKYFGVVESSTDGTNWDQQLIFEHNGTYYNEQPKGLFAGKIPPLCEPSDHSSSGDMGQCRIDYVRLCLY